MREVMSEVMREMMREVMREALKIEKIAIPRRVENEQLSKT